MKVAGSIVMEMNERDGADVERCGATDESVDWGPAICYKTQDISGSMHHIRRSRVSDTRGVR